VALTDAMKKKFGLLNKLRGYPITIISDRAVKMATQILARKVMQNCHSDEVRIPIVALVAQCMEGV